MQFGDDQIATGWFLPVERRRKENVLDDLDPLKTERFPKRSPKNDHVEALNSWFRGNSKIYCQNDPPFEVAPKSTLFP